MLEMAQHIHLAFFIAGRCVDARAQLRPELRPLRCGMQCAGIQQLIEQNWMAREVFCSPRACAREACAARECLRVLEQKREISLAPADTFEQR